MHTGGHNMQKEIKVSDYLKELGKRWREAYRNKPVTVENIYVNANVFYEIFGADIAERIIKINESQKEGTEEEYKVLFILYKEMGNDLAERFISELSNIFYETNEGAS